MPVLRLIRNPYWIRKLRSLILVRNKKNLLFIKMLNFLEKWINNVRKNRREENRKGKNLFLNNYSLKIKNRNLPNGNKNKRTALFIETHHFLIL